MNLEQTLLEMFTVWQKGQGKEERKEHRLKRVELKKEELSCPPPPHLIALLSWILILEEAMS